MAGHALRRHGPSGAELRHVRPAPDVRTVYDGAVKPSDASEEEKDAVEFSGPPLTKSTAMAPPGSCLAQVWCDSAPGGACDALTSDSQSWSELSVIPARTFAEAASEERTRTVFARPATPPTYRS